MNTVTEVPALGQGPSAISWTAARVDTDGLTEQTVRRMEEIIRQSVEDPLVRTAGQDATKHLSNPTRRQLAESVWTWLTQHIRFRPDEQVLSGVLGMQGEAELLIHPNRLLTMPEPAADCDDFVMVGCSMLLGLGVPCQIVTIAADRSQPGRWSHVYFQAQTETGWLPLDTSHGWAPGWEASDYTRKRAWSLLTPKQRSGLNGYARASGLGQDDELPWWQELMRGGLDIAKQVTLPTGTYIQNRGGVISRTVPGAIPGQYPGTGYNIGANVTGIGTGTILLGVLGIGLLLALTGGRR